MLFVRAPASASASAPEKIAVVFAFVQVGARRVAYFKRAAKLKILKARNAVCHAFSRANALRALRESSSRRELLAA